MNSIFFTIFNYPMSYVEFIGTIFNFLCVYLVVKNKALNWPVGIVGIVLFMVLFFQIQLYSDFFEQIYYLITSFWGWWMWTRVDNKNIKKQLQISRLASARKLVWLSIIILGGILLWQIVIKLNSLLPTIFVSAAKFPLLDAVTTMMSFVATILMGLRKIENWMLWILVDILGIFIYFFSGVPFVALLYVAFLIMATSGYLSWKKELNSYV